MSYNNLSEFVLYFLMKIFFQVKKPKVKVKVFTEKEEAVKWITTIRNAELELGKN